MCNIRSAMASSQSSSKLIEKQHRQEVNPIIYAHRTCNMQHKKPKWIQLHRYDLFHFGRNIIIALFNTMYIVHIFALIINFNFTPSTNFFLMTNCTGIRSKQNGFRWTEAKYLVKENHQIENQYHYTIHLPGKHLVNFGLIE